jgi:hypothetical protein
VAELRLLIRNDSLLVLLSRPFMEDSEDADMMEAMMIV